MSSEGPRKVDSAFKSFLAGGFGGVCLVLSGHPFDLIKVRMQTLVLAPGEVPPFRNTWDCARLIITKEGFGGLYRGVQAPLIAVAPIFATCFWGYDIGQKLVRSAVGKSHEQSLSIFEISLAGGFSAIPTTAVMAPGERIKCLLQIQGQQAEKGIPIKYHGMLDCAKQLYREGGAASIFRGWEATLLRDIPGSMAYFALYEIIKKGLTPAGASPDHLSAGAVLFAGGMAGVANWTIAIPADVIKSRLQTAPPGTFKGVLDCYRQLIKAEGHGALVKGMGPALTRAFPANAACFLGVEVAKKFLTEIGIE